MAVSKFNWHGTNPNKAFHDKNPPMAAWGEMVKLDATKEETEAAYNALVNGGKVSDFKTKVWNDICAKVYDLCDEWQINDTYRKYSVWSPFIHVPDRKAWETLAKKNWPDWDEYQINEWVDSIWSRWKPGTFTAWSYNVVYSQWLLPVGIQKFEVQKGQRLKGEYILRLVEIVNHWTELTPLTVRFKLTSRWEKKGKCVVLPVISVEPEYVEMHFTLRERTRVDDSIQIHITLDLNLLIEKMSIVELTSCPLSSLINFMKMNVKCKIWDKFPVNLSIDIGMVHEGSASPIILSLVYVKALWNSIFQTMATGDIGFVLDGFGVFLKAAISGHVLPSMADAYGFSFAANNGEHRGTAKIRTRRPLPFSFLAKHGWEGRILVEHQGTLLLFMEDGSVSFADSSLLTVDTATKAEQHGSIAVRKNRADGEELDAVSLVSETDKIVYHGKEIEGRVAGTVSVSHRERLKTASSQTMQKIAASPISFDGDMHGMRGGAEISFANEQSFAMREGSFGVREDDIGIDFQDTAVLEMQDTYDTEETITLSDAPPFEIGGAEVSVLTEESAAIERNKSIEAAADAIVESIQSGEISFGLNANLEAETVAGKIASVAMLEANRRAVLGSEVDVSTIESAIADRVLRKLMESSISVETRTRASMILTMLRFAESMDNVVSVSSSSEVLARLPKTVQGKTQYIHSQTDAFIDISYIRGDGLLADAKIRVEADVMPETINSGTYLVALAIVEICYETMLDKMPSAAVESEAIATAGSEAGVVLARSVLILVSDVEDNLVLEEDTVSAADFERTLTID